MRWVVLRISRTYSTKRVEDAKITINYPEKLNTCTPVTVYEISKAFIDEWTDRKRLSFSPAQGIKHSALVGISPSEIWEDTKDTATRDSKERSLPCRWRRDGQIITFLIRHIPRSVIAGVNGCWWGHVWQVTAIYQKLKDVI